MSESTFSLEKERLQTFLRNVRQEVLNIQSGDSKYRSGAMHFEKGISGAMNRLEMFQNNPTKRNLDEFLALAKQDFGIAVEAAFAAWAGGIFTELDETSKPVVAKKSFEVKVKDVLYDLLKAGRIPLDPKQMEHIERIASQFQSAIQGEVSGEIGTQLKSLVAKMNEKKAVPAKKANPKPKDPDPEPSAQEIIQKTVNDSKPILEALE